jgi:hypothetical protein
MAYYGSLAGVAALCKIYTDNGVFTDAGCLDCLQVLETNPTRTEVVNWMEDISGALDTTLAGEGFVVPIVNTTAVKSINIIVNQYTADLVKYANNSGRFATDAARASGIEPFITIEKNIRAWAHNNAAGLEAVGAARADVPGNQVFTKTNTPIFSRNAFGNKFQDWDTADDDRGAGYNKG